MSDSLLNKMLKIFKYLLCFFSITFSVIPGYNLLGDLVKQIFVTVAVSFILILVFDLILKIEPYVFSGALAFMSVFWVSFAVFKQIEVKLECSDKSLNWFHLFYYDRPALLFVVFFVCMFYFIIKLMIKKDNEEFKYNYKKFIKFSTYTFLVYYLVVIFYAFFLVRKITFIRPDVSFTPFETILFTFSRSPLDYELLFLFLGNIAIFLPLGILFSALIKKKSFLVMFPLLLSFLIELSQYFLGNGNPDVDDVILNVSGFYIGVVVKLFLEFLVLKSTKGKIRSIFFI